MGSAGRLWVTVVVAGCASGVGSAERADVATGDEADATEPDAIERQVPPPTLPPSTPGCGACPTTSQLPADCRSNAGTVCNPPPPCEVTCTRHVALLCNPRIGLRLFPRECARDDECLLALHQTDCCGNARAYAIRRYEMNEFASYEAACRMLTSACGCPASAPVADDGRSAGETAAGCVEGLCRTFVR